MLSTCQPLAPPSSAVDESVTCGGVEVGALQQKTRRISPLGAALFVVWIDAASLGIAVPIMPDLIASISGDTVSSTAWYLGWFGSSYAAMQFLCAPLLGRLSDRFGRFPLLVAAMLALTFDSIILILANSVTLLWIGRIIAGAVGSSVATANALVADQSTDANRVKNFGLVGAMYGLGLVMGPAIGAMLGLVHLRLPFAVTGLLAAAAAIFLRTTFVAQSSKTAGAMANTGKAAVTQSADGRKPLGQRVFIRCFAIAVFLSSLAQRGIESLFVIFTATVFAWSREQAGFALCFMGIMALIVQAALAQPVVSRIGPCNSVLASLCFLIATYLGMAMIQQGWLVYPLLALGSLSGIAGPALQSFITAKLEPNEQGQLQGYFVSIVSLSSIIAPLGFTTFLFRSSLETVALPLEISIPFVVAACLAACSGFFAWLGFFNSTEQL